MTDPTDDQLRERLTAALRDVSWRGKELTEAHARVLADTARPTVRALMAEAETRGRLAGYRDAANEVHVEARFQQERLSALKFATDAAYTRDRLIVVETILTDRADRLEAPSE